MFSCIEITIIILLGRPDSCTALCLLQNIGYNDLHRQMSTGTVTLRQNQIDCINILPLRSYQQIYHFSVSFHITRVLVCPHNSLSDIIIHFALLPPIIRNNHNISEFSKRICKLRVENWMTWQCWIFQVSEEHENGRRSSGATRIIHVELTVGWICLGIGNIPSDCISSRELTLLLRCDRYWRKLCTNLTLRSEETACGLCSRNAKAGMSGFVWSQSLQLGASWRWFVSRR